MQAKIGSEYLKWISHKKLSTFPQFLRFDTVELSYDGGLNRRIELYSQFDQRIKRRTKRRAELQSISKKCQLSVKHLQPLKAALKESNLIYFVGRICQKNLDEFQDHSQLINHLREELLPICNSARLYKFRICFNSDKNSTANVITSILEMVHGSNVEIELYSHNPNKLPIDSIAKWLGQEGNRINAIDQKKQVKFLKIQLVGIQNVFEMCGHLTEVISKFFRLKFKIAH